MKEKKMKQAGIKFILLVLSAVIICPINAIAKQFFGIVDYKPAEYVESVSEPFFYSIGKTLRYDRTINDTSPVVFKGSFFGDDLREVFVSPDNQKAAVFYGDKLYLARTTGPALLLLSDCRFNKFKVGETYYSELQWDEESRIIYMIRGSEHVRTPQSSWRAPDAALVRIDINSPGKVVEVISNFNSLNYFFVGDDTICFNYGRKDGNVEWRCAQNGKISRVKLQQNGEIILENGMAVQGRPFVSYDQGNTYESEIWLSNYGFTTKRTEGNITVFFSKNDSSKPLFKIQGGHNIKGHYVDGIAQTGCKVLPGGRYALLNVAHDNFRGQLLVDGETGKYRELPANTKVFLNLNSLNYDHFKFDLGPTKHPEFLPAARLR